MALRRKSRGLLLAAAGAVLWSLFQLFSVIAHGQIFSGPYANIRWITYAEEPGWFVTAIGVYLLVILLCSAFMIAHLIWPDDR